MDRARIATEPECRAPPLIVRAIEPSDAGAYRSILERTTEEDRYCRFFHVVNHFDTADVSRFVDPRLDTIGFVAVAGSTPLGAAHAFFVSADEAELAIVVARDARRRGVGRALIERLLGALRHRRCSRATAIALNVNGAFGRLAKISGMSPQTSAGGITTWELELAVPAPAEGVPKGARDFPA